MLKKRNLIVWLIIALTLSMTVILFANENGEHENEQIFTELYENELKPEIKPPTVTFAGDLLIWGSVENQLETYGNIGIFEDNGEINQADILMLNLEYAISHRGTAQDKQWAFRSNPKHIKFLTDLKVDIVSLANNHSIDYGREAFDDTMNLLTQNGIVYVGGGRNYEEASRFHIKEVRGKKIAFIAASRVIPHVSWYATNTRSGLFGTYDTEGNNSLRGVLTRIREAKQEADFVVIYVHWGVERASHPQEWQRSMAKQYIDAGASAVIGSHPHVLQGIEFYKGKPIIYSLSNFIFTDAQKDTMIATLTFDDEISVKVDPYVIRARKTSIVSGAERSRILRYLQQISFNAQVNEDGTVVEKR